MTFPEIINTYLDILDCTASELAKESGITSASLSRYRNGQRVPETDTLKKISDGISKIASKRELTDIDYDSVYEKFIDELGIVETDNSQFSGNFANLVNMLEINLNELARGIGYDPSYISRLKKGQRVPSDINVFAENLSQFLIRKYSKSEEINRICSLIDYSFEDNNLVCEDFTAAMTNYLCSNSGEDKTKDQIGGYLKKLDEFDLNEYITIIKFDKIKVPTAPFSLPASRNYYGIEEMKQGELDFFKATALSRSREPIFMNSDMPMADMAEDMDFNKKWMFGIAACLKKGLHLNMIHNIDRPLEEMILGLEAWIPIYMTGQIRPYYLKGLNTDIYHHLNYVSGAAALTGECINGYHNDGKYYLTNSKREVAYYRNKTDHILSKAFPLMDIYTEDSREGFYSFVRSESVKSGERSNLYSTLPLYTISDELFISILKRNHISEDKQQVLLENLKIIKNNFVQSVQSGSVEDMIPVLSQKEYTDTPLTLSLSGTFCEDEIYCTYEEYYQHYEQTIVLAEVYQNYTVSAEHTRIFKNIQIQIKHNEWIMISKNKSPVIHFVIHHPKMIRAIENGLPW